MWKSLIAGGALAASAWAQTSPQIEVANLREDVRGLAQRVAELTLRLEQAERDNAELRRRSGSEAAARVTLAQVQEAVAEAQKNAREAIASSKAETLQHVAAQIEKLAKQTNTAIDSLAKNQGVRPVASATGTAAAPGKFAEDFPKEGVSYVVQKGDTLAVIAKKTGAKQQDIVNANKLADPSRIVVGQTLFIPGGK